MGLMQCVWSNIMLAQYSDAILCWCLQYYADVMAWCNNMLMQLYDTILCWCNNLVQYCGVMHVQSGPWCSCFLDFHETQRNRIHKRIRKRQNFHDPCWVCRTSSSSPSLLNLFSNQWNRFLKVIFSQNNFLKMSIFYFTHKNLAPDQFLQGVKIYWSHSAF